MFNSLAIVSVHGRANITCTVAAKKHMQNLATKNEHDNESFLFTESSNQNFN